MKYTPATIAKAITGGAVAAIGAATAAAGGPDLSVLDVGQWIGVFGTGLVAAAGVFAVPNKDHKPAPEAAPPPPLDDIAISAVEQVIADATNAVAVRDRVAQGVTEAFGGIVTGGVTAVAGQVAGSLADQVVRAVLPRT